MKRCDPVHKKKYIFVSGTTDAGGGKILRRPVEGREKGTPEEGR